MHKILITLAALFFSLGQALAQSDGEKNEIKAVVNELFDAYRAGDSARVANVFTKDAIVQSIYLNGDGTPVASEASSINTFIDYIGKGLTELHDEKLWDTKIHSDKMMATVWTRYAFFLGEKFTHCGTETFLLRKVNSSWKIFILVDTRQTQGCQLPKNFK
jgi:hypothetical protein